MKSLRPLFAVLALLTAIPAAHAQLPPFDRPIGDIPIFQLPTRTPRPTPPFQRPIDVDDNTGIQRPTRIPTTSPTSVSSPTATASPTVTATPTRTPTSTATSSATTASTGTPGGVATISSGQTPSATRTAQSTKTPGATPTVTTTGTVTPNPTTTVAPTQTVSISQTANPTPVSTSNLPTLESNFLQAYAQSNTAEITLSQLAVDRASRKQVKDYAADIISDHAIAGTQLQQLASQEGVILNAALDPAHAALAAVLSQLSGRTFDRVYLETMVLDHLQSLRLATLVARYGTDAEVKAFAAAQIPILRKHLRVAQRLLLSRRPQGNNASRGRGILGSSRGGGHQG